MGLFADLCVGFVAICFLCVLVLVADYVGYRLFVGRKSDDS